MREAKRRKVAIKAAARFDTFAQYLLKDERTHIPIKFSQLHHEWAKHVHACEERGEYWGILSMVGSGKSSIFAIAKPLYHIAKEPSLCSTILSNNQKTARKRVTVVKKLIEESQELKRVFPHCQPDYDDKWAESAITVQRPPGIKDPSLEAYGIEMSPTGARIWRHLSDDVCDFLNTIGEPVMRLKIIDNWYFMYDNRLDKDSMAGHIGTVQHEEDLNMVLSKDDRWHFIVQRISDDFTHIVQEDLKTGKHKKIPLWGLKWTPEYLAKKCASNERSFNRAFRNQGYSDEDCEFDKDAINDSRMYGRWEDIVPEDANYVGGVDLSGKGRKGNIIIHIAVGPDKRRYLWKETIRAGAWKSPRTSAELVEACELWSANRTMVETNGYQTALIEWCEATNLNPPNLAAFHTGASKKHEEFGVPGLAAEIKAGKWTFIYEKKHDLMCPCNLCCLIREIRAWPNSGYSDYVMALWLARQAAMKYGSKEQILIGHGKSGSARGRDKARSRRDEAMARLRDRRRKSSR